jgi:hypothetical protein
MATRKASTRKASRKAQAGGKKTQAGGKKTRKMNKKASAWTAFVKKIYLEMKKKNPNVKLGAAMKEASRRKSEM